MFRMVLDKNEKGLTSCLLVNPLIDGSSYLVARILYKVGIPQLIIRNWK